MSMTQPKKSYQSPKLQSVKVFLPMMLGTTGGGKKGPPIPRPFRPFR